MMMHIGLVTFIGVVQFLGALALWITLPAWVNEAQKVNEHQDMHIIERGIGNLAGYTVIGLLVVGMAGCVLTVLGSV